MKNCGKVISALLGGIAIGSVVGILFAPDKGCATRESLGEALADLKDALKESAEERFDQLTDFKDRIAASLKSKAERAEQIIDDEIEEHA